MAARLVLGTVQLGLQYGAANRTGKPSRREAIALVRHALDAGISDIDTARSYGESEERLGEAIFGRKPVRTITKLSPLSELAADAPPGSVRAAVDNSIAQSLKALRVEHIDCLLLHRAQHIVSHGGAVWERVRELVECGKIFELGVSVQTPGEALTVLECADVCHIQLPFNILDWRWRESGVIRHLEERGDITVHIRSVFLQGVLINGPEVWPPIDGANPDAYAALIVSLAREFGREGAADLCLAYARAQPWIDGIVVGMETDEQLNENLRLFQRPPLSLKACRDLEARIPRAPESLLNPAIWPSRMVAA